MSTAAAVLCALRGDMPGSLRLILGDQLSQDISSLKDCDKDRDIILMAEVWDEATYVRHHKKKIAFLFSAMRHFAAELEDKGYEVHYAKLDDEDNAGSFAGEVERAVRKREPEKIIVTHPGEYRVLKDMQGWEKRFGVPVEIRDDDRFLSSPDDFKDWAEGRKSLRMEYFYREMRKRYGILMDGDEPEGGDWNYDSENREKIPGDIDVPKLRTFRPDDITKEVLDLVEKRFPDHFGDLEPFQFAVTRKEALEALNHFIEHRLAQFGSYQDAMKQGEPFLYHSVLSPYINAGLLSPREVIEKAEDAYEKGAVPLNAAEGFVRQILGWREYVRGIYWLKMPDYAEENFFAAKRDLPEFYWTGETEMNCLKQCITETREHAYAHHIQRLMVLGNFALLAGIDPAQVNEWYLIVYADAYEWVEMPNVTGMILFADGGLLASKPYAASGAYIDNMSDYCKECRYNVKEKNGENACPFNYLYWDFLARNADKLRGNNRLSMIYKTLSRMSDDKKRAVKEDSERFLEAI